MKRFTEQLKDGDIRLNIADYGEPPYPVVTNDFIRRFAEYEDTGLTPDEIRVLQEYHDLHTHEDVEASKYVLVLIKADRRKSELSNI